MGNNTILVTDVVYGVVNEGTCPRVLLVQRRTSETQSPATSKHTKKSGYPFRYPQRKDSIDLVFID
jgi:hypothetical protein